jgi:hypothetical protein
MVVHACNPSSGEAGKRMTSLKPAWTTWQDPQKKNLTNLRQHFSKSIL